MTADPKVISNAYVIEHLTFVEAMELCNFGAKVILSADYLSGLPQQYSDQHPQYVQPGCAGNLRLEGKGWRQPYDQGYFVDQRYLPDYHQGFGYGRCDRRQLPHLQSPVEIGVSACSSFRRPLRKTQPRSVCATAMPHWPWKCSAEFAQEIAMGEINKIKTDHDLATVAIVGENMKRRPGVAGKLFDTLGRNGINVDRLCTGALRRRTFRSS